MGLAKYISKRCEHGKGGGGQRGYTEIRGVRGTISVSQAQAPLEQARALKADERFESVNPLRIPYTLSWQHTFLAWPTMWVGGCWVWLLGLDEV